MGCEWAAYREFNAVTEISAPDLERLLSRRPAPRIVDMRWVITTKAPD